MDLLLDPWTLDFHSGIPVYRQIMDRIQVAVAQGKLKQGDRLPTIRALHQKLDVNPNTVARAYRELALGGVIESEQGSGCFVAPPTDPTPPRLNAREREVKFSQLATRISAEARNQGIPVEDLLEYMKQKASHSKI